MPPPQVGVIKVQPASVPLVTELPGRLEASREAQVRARVAGIVHKRLFREGSDVKAGQALFQIDPATYQASVNSAQASLTKAQANLDQASALLKRYKPLIDAKAISPQEYLNAEVGQRQAQAEVAAGQAALQTARINLGYATVTAPISGRIGRALVTEGALVGQGEATPLAFIQQTSPLFVNFTQSASEVLRLRQAMEKGGVQGGAATSVEVVLDDGSVYPLPGRLLFADLSVDSTSGQISLRAEVPNPKGALLPGLYVRVRLQQGTVEGAYLVPQQAITRGAGGDTLMVVAPDGKVSVRPVQLGGQVGTSWIVRSGLSAGEQVIVDGFQKMMNPNAPVQPVPWAPSGASAPAGAQAPAAAASR